MKSRLFGRSAIVSAVMVLAFLVVCGTLIASANENALEVPQQLDQAIVVDGGWYPFYIYGPAGSFNDEGAFLFASTTYVNVVVTDVLCKGDQFKVYDNGVPIGDTSVVPGDIECDDPGNTNEPDVAYADPTYSHGSFLIGPGSHAITIQVTVPYYPESQSLLAYLRVDSSDYKPIPTLSQWGVIIFLVLLAGSAVWIMRRRRTTA